MYFPLAVDFLCAVDFFLAVDSFRALTLTVVDSPLSGLFPCIDSHRSRLSSQWTLSSQLTLSPQSTFSPQWTLSPQWAGLKKKKGLHYYSV